MTISTAKLMELKRQAGGLRDKILQANATMTEVNNNIKTLKDELTDLGIKDIEQADTEIQAMEQEVEKLYDEAYAKIEKWI